MSFIQLLSISLALGSGLVAGDDSCHETTDENQLLSKPIHSTSMIKAITGGSVKSTSKLLEQMRHLAHKVSSGQETISDEMTKVLDNIHDEMDNIIAEAERIHKNDQAAVNERRDAIQQCSTAASNQLVIVGNKKEAMDSKRTEHNTCRSRQLSEMTDTTTKCNDFQSFWSTDSAKTAPDCLGSYPGTSAAIARDCLRKLKAWEQETSPTFDDKQELCDKATEKLQATITECESIQDTFETSTCDYSSKLTDTCEEQETCRTHEIASRESAHARVKDDEKARKNEFTSASKIKCYIDVLRATGAARTAKLAECDQLQPDESSVHMVYPDIPAETACDPSPADKKPCTEEWLGIVYHGEAWYNKESQNTYTSSTERVSPRTCSPCEAPTPPPTQAPTTSPPSANAPTTAESTGSDEEAEAPAESWHQGNIAVGQYGACALKEDGTPVCWGRIGNRGNYQHRSSLPANSKYYSIVRKGTTVCGIKKPERTLECAGEETWKPWGGDENDAARKNVQLKKIALGSDQRICGIKMDNTLMCLAYLFSHSFKDGIPEGEFANVDCGLNGCCGVRTDGSLVCFGRPDDHWGANALAPQGQFIDVAVGDGGWQCALKSDRTTVQCWGKNYNYPQTGVQLGTTAAEGKTFDSIEAWENNHIGRGLMNDGTVQSWGDSRKLAKDTYPGGEWKSIDSHADTACGIRRDGSALCWSSGYINAGKCFHGDEQSCDTPQGVTFKID